MGSSMSPLTSKEMRGLVAYCSLLLTGCDTPAPDTQMQTTSPSSIDKREIEPMVGPRFAVTRVGVFHDPIAYDSVRGIYVIRDSQTGREYVGISGIGIAETGSHRAGKTTVEDEQ